MSNEEQAMLQALAERDGLSVSDYIRLRIRRDHTEAFGDEKPKAKKKR